VYTAVYRSCTRLCTLYTCIRPCTRPCTWAAYIHGRMHGRVHGSVHRPCPRPCTVRVQVYSVHSRVHDRVEGHYYDSVSVVIGHESYSTTRSRICSGLCCLCLSPLSFAGFLMNFSISPLFVVVLGDLHSNLVQSVQSVPDILRLPIYRLSYDNVGLLATFVTLFA